MKKFSSSKQPLPPKNGDYSFPFLDTFSLGDEVVYVFLTALLFPGLFRGSTLLRAFGDAFFRTL